MNAVETKLPEREVITEEELDELELRREAEARPLRVRSMFCQHGLLPDYCARCKYGDKIHGELVDAA